MEYIKAQGLVGEEQIKRIPLLIDRSNIQVFLQMAASSLLELRRKNMDLQAAIWFYVRGSETEYLDVAFAMLFLALEKIKDIYAGTNQIELIMSESEFKQLKKKFKSLVNEDSDFDTIRDLIKRKFNELNRRSIRDIVEMIFNEYSVEWKDLYPRNSELSILKTRNVLFHSSKELDSTLLFKETIRLKILIERLITKMLGWNGYISESASLNREWLVNSNDGMT